MAMAFSLAGRRALVTGASGGLGQAMALALARAGAEIVCAGRSDMGATIRQVEQMGGTAFALQCDLSRPQAPERMIASAWETDRPLDILVNNAGTLTRSDATDVTEAEWDTVMELNARQVFFTAQAFGRRVLAAGRRAKIINVGSIMSMRGGHRIAPYAASKHAVAGITRHLACEWASRGINVNAIAPGFFDTEMNGAMKADRARYEASLARIPAGTWAEPSAIGGAAVFLASAASDYVHGILLPVDGGWLAR
ncbi:MAG: SDR family oxidoreductase [Rhizobiaceae bacterium]|nr:SDR family oxidoreductase [Rhizobiaceae bacterium]